jgi:hypothetical protein
MKCNKEELRPPGAAPRPRKNQRPGGTHRPHPPGRPEPASQEPRKQPPATDTRTLRVRASAPNNPQRHPQPANLGHPDNAGHTPPPKRRPPQEPHGACLYSATWCLSLAILPIWVSISASFICSSTLLTLYMWHFSNVFGCFPFFWTLVTFVVSVTIPS